MASEPGAPEPGQPPLGPAAEPGAPEPEWHRVHPVTPLVRGWMIVVVVGLGILRSVAESFPENGMASAQTVGRSWPQISIGVLVFAAVVAVYCWLAWKKTTYAIDGESVRIHSGVLFRKLRRTRLDRLQAVDLVRPLLARAFALAELRLEVAGGEDSAVKLGFLKLDDATRLRSELLARAAGIKVAEGLSARTAGGDGPAPTEIGVPEAPERPVTAVPTGRLVGSLALSGATFWFVGSGIVLAVLAITSGAPEVLVGAIPVVIGLGSFLFSRFSGEFGFRSAISPDGIRLQRGLLDTRSQTIPPGRVQAIVLVQGILWRRAGWWRVWMNVAGYADSEDGWMSTGVLLPVGSADEAATAVWLVLPDLGVQNPRELVERGLTGRSAGDGYVGVPRRARWLDPIIWRRTAVAVTDRALLIRHGRITRRLQIVPHERTQSLGLKQGPLQRRLGVATFALHSTPGPVVPQVPHLDAEAAAELLGEQAERARTARASAGSELWMRRDEVPS